MLKERNAPVNKYWEDDSFNSYVKKHGQHFSEKLAMFASERLRPTNGRACWTAEDVKGAFAQLGLTIPSCNTIGDVVYEANKAYYIHYGKSLKTEADCLKHAHTTLVSSNSYQGLVFNRWLADVMGMNITVDWASMM